MIELLGERLTADERHELEAAVAAGRRTAVRLADAHTRALDLVLTPTPIEGFWIGTLGTLGTRTQPPDVRIESATLQPVREPPIPGVAASSGPVVTKILDGIRSLIGIQDADGRYVLVNTAMAEFHGLARDAFIGRTQQQIALPAGALLPATAEPPETEPAIEREVELTDATGRHRRFEVVRRTVQSAENRATYVLAVATETSAEETREPAQRLSGAARPGALEEVFASLHAVAFQCGVRPELMFTRVDDVAEELFAVPAAQLLGRVDRLLAYALDGNVEARRARWQALAEEGQSWDEQLEILNAKGEPRWLRIAARPAAEGPGEYRGVMLDVTEAKAAEGRLHEAEQRLDLALANGNLGLVDWHVDSDRIIPNPQLARLLELAAPESVSSATELARFEHPRDKARIHAELRAHLDGKSPEFHCEYRVRTEHGRVRWVLASGKVVKRAPDGRPLRYVGTVQDITESLEAEQELERQLARSHEITRVSTDLAREVKQLELEIREISQREQQRIGHDLHDGLGQELTGASLMLKALEDAIQRDAPQLRARVHSVRDMVEQCIATTRSLAQGLAPVHLDRDGFAGALEALAANSESLFGIPVRFAHDRNGVVPSFAAANDLYRIAQEAIRNAARHAGAREITVRLSVTDEHLVVAVEDDGAGMTSSAETHGGMGLKIMRYRAGIIGAALDIGARDGGGTVVRCTLRRAAENMN